MNRFANLAGFPTTSNREKKVWSLWGCSGLTSQATPPGMRGDGWPRRLLGGSMQPSGESKAVVSAFVSWWCIWRSNSKRDCACGDRVGRFSARDARPRYGDALNEAERTSERSISIRKSRAQECSIFAASSQCSALPCASEENRTSFLPCFRVLPADGSPLPHTTSTVRPPRD